jgi:hypothetical protein
MVEAQMQMPTHSSAALLHHTARSEGGIIRRPPRDTSAACGRLAVEFSLSRAARARCRSGQSRLRLRNGYRVCCRQHCPPDHAARALDA